MFEIVADIPASACRQPYELIARTIYLSHAFDSRCYDAGCPSVFHLHYLS
jgi:hypothetical protein